MVAWAALAFALVALWLMMGRELWLHYFELPRKYAHYREVHPPYFTGTYWMFTPRFLWHLILPVTAVLSAVQALSGRQNGDVEPGATPNGGPAAPVGKSGVTGGPPSVS